MAKINTYEDYTNSITCDQHGSNSGYFHQIQIFSKIFEKKILEEKKEKKIFS